MSWLIGVGMPAIAACRAVAADPAPGDAQPPAQLVLDLADGSRIVGTPDATGFKVKTEYAEIDVKLSVLRSVSFAVPGGEARLGLQNGDTLNGKLAATEIPMKTLFGPVTIPLDQVVKIRAGASTAEGAKDMPDGLVLYYSFDAGSGDQVTDESSSGNDATIHGATRVKEGKIGDAMSFSGTGEVITAKNEDKLQLQDFTIMAWIKRGSVDKPSGSWQDGVVLGCGQAGYAMGIHDDGTIFLCKVGYNAVFSPCKITDLAFHHVAVTKSGAKVVFYLDGKAYPTEYNTNFEFGHGVGVGSRPDMDGPMAGCFLGIIDEVAVFNRPLKEDEVESVYESQK